MPAKRNWAVGVYNAFYWIGIVMTPASWVLILAGNTETIWQFEHVGFPLSWAFAGAAMLAFLAAEFCHCVFSLGGEAENVLRNSQAGPPVKETREAAA
jgi:hypothetical protein